MAGAEACLSWCPVGPPPVHNNSEHGSWYISPVTQDRDDRVHVLRPDDVLTDWRIAPCWCYRNAIVVQTLLKRFRPRAEVHGVVGRDVCVVHRMGEVYRCPTSCELKPSVWPPIVMSFSVSSTSFVPPSPGNERLKLASTIPCAAAICLLSTLVARANWSARPASIAPSRVGQSSTPECAYAGVERKSERISPPRPAEKCSRCMQPPQVPYPNSRALYRNAR